ncbi:hypothetical protein D3C81_1992690 [compost metagenome]
MLHNFLVEDIPTRPTECRGQGQEETQQRHMLPVQTCFNQHQYAQHREHYSRQLFALKSFPKHQGAETNGEKRLSL